MILNQARQPHQKLSEFFAANHLIHLRNEEESEENPATTISREAREKFAKREPETLKQS